MFGRIISLGQSQDGLDQVGTDAATDTAIGQRHHPFLDFV